jgi:TetR/AcrR family transcriptional repressor of bet genes
VNFSAGQFREEIVHAWLAFYVEAQKSRSCAACSGVYARRLHSNLMSGLLPLVPRAEAERMAEAIAAMIDGLYIRRALRDGLPNPGKRGRAGRGLCRCETQEDASGQ